MTDHSFLSRIQSASGLLRLSLDYPVGTIDLIATATHLTGIILRDATSSICPFLEVIPPGENVPLVRTRQFLSRYFYGHFSPCICHTDCQPENTQHIVTLINPCPDIKSIDLDLSIYTLNEISIYRLLVNTEICTTLSYKSLARLAGIPKGARFVGNTMAKNIFPILIPCHRVIRSDGTMGRYSGGVGVKEFLLKHEDEMVRQGAAIY